MTTNTIATRKSVLGVMPEVTEGVPLLPTGATKYVAMQDDFDITLAADRLENAELAGSIGKKPSVLGAEKPTVKSSHYMRGSGVEGQAPGYHEYMKALAGSEVVAASEKAAAGGSTTLAVNLETGDGAAFQRGQGLLVKHAAGANEFSVVHAVAGDVLTPAFPLASAPASGTGLGKCVFWPPADEGHQTLAVTRYLGNGGARQTVAGLRPDSLTIAADAGGYVNGSFSFRGIKAYFNGFEVTDANKHLDFEDDDGTFAAEVATGWYSNPHALAAAIQNALNAANPGDAKTVSYLDASGKYKVTGAGTLLTLKWSTGANKLTSIGPTVGFPVSADSSGTGAATGYTGAALSWAAPHTPSLDAAKPVAAKLNVLRIGTPTDNVTFQASKVELTYEDEVGEIKDVTSETGIAGTLVTGRKIAFKATALLNRHDASWFKRWKDGDEVRALYAWGRKVGGSWVAGETMYAYLPTLVIDDLALPDENGLTTVEISGSAVVGADGLGEVYIGQQ